MTGNSGVGSFTAPSTGSTAPATGTAPSGGQQEALGPTQRTSDCVSLGPSGGGCDTGNVAAPIGLAALGLVAALFTWDAVRQRRRLQFPGGARTGVEVSK